mgnify:CR=1 FL=1
MLESAIERYFCREIKNAGGLAMKFVSPGLSGVPDRIVILPMSKIYFVELKQKGKKPRKLQRKVFNRFLKLGFKTYILDSYEVVDKFVEEVTKNE